MNADYKHQARINSL